MSPLETYILITVVGFIPCLLYVSYYSPFPWSPIRFVVTPLKVLTALGFSFITPIPIIIAIAGLIVGIGCLILYIGDTFPHISEWFNKTIYDLNFEKDDE